jgi:hypothetical protein
MGEEEIRVALRRLRGLASVNRSWSPGADRRPLKPGATIQSAQAELRILAKQLERHHPERNVSRRNWSRWRNTSTEQRGRLCLYWLVQSVS